MFSTLRNRFGIPGVISVIALVFALVGGAFAANQLGSSGKGATASAKKKAVKGPRGPRGATGPAGPAGPAGSAGAKGDSGAAGAAGKDGAAGAKGATGTDGQSVTVTEEPQFTGECGDAGGYKLESGSGTDYVCNGTEGPAGEDGSPWVMGKAPGGVMLKGTWAVSYNAAAGNEELFVPISTGVPIGEVLLVMKGPEPAFGCTGSLSEPKAEPTEVVPGGVLCVYQDPATTNLKPLAFEGDLLLGTSGGGAVIRRKTNAAGFVKGYGTWALSTLP